MILFLFFEILESLKFFSFLVFFLDRIAKSKDDKARPQVKFAKIFQKYLLIMPFYFIV